MILRVYAMWGRCKWILSVLLFVCVPQVVISIVLAGIYYNPNTYFSGTSCGDLYWSLWQFRVADRSSSATVTIIQVGGFSVCNGLSKIPSPLLLGLAIPRLALGITLFILAAIPTLKESIEMYKATQIWQPNQYMQRLMRDGVLYFFVYVTLSPSPSPYFLSRSRLPTLTPLYR